MRDRAPASEEQRDDREHAGAILASLLDAILAVVRDLLESDRLGESLAHLAARALGSEQVDVYLRRDGVDAFELLAHVGQPQDECAARLAMRAARRALEQAHVVHLATDRVETAAGGSLTGAPPAPVWAHPIRSAGRGAVGAVVAVAPSRHEHDAAWARDLALVGEIATSAFEQAHRLRARIAHQGELEERLRARTEEVAQARGALMRQERAVAMGKLAASIAHEVNNPMSFVLSCLSEAMRVSHGLEQLMPDVTRLADLASRLPESDDPHIERVRLAAGKLGGDRSIDAYVNGEDGLCDLIGEALEGAERIRRISDDVRRFAQGQPGIPDWTNVNAIVDTALHLADLDHIEDIRVVRRLEILPEVRCQRHQITQVMLNLIQNAIDALEGRGIIEVRTRSAGDWVEIEVADDGPGIEPSIRERIFESFYTRKSQGTGIGLAISRDIATAHAGTLAVIGSATGACLQLKLPVSGP